MRATAAFISGGSNSGRMFINLKSLAQRGVGVEEIIARLRRKLAVVEGVTLYMQASQELRVGAHTSKSTFQYHHAGLEPGRAAALVRRPDEGTEKGPAFPGRDERLPVVRPGGRGGGRSAAAARLNLNFLNIDNTLYDAFGQRQVSTIYTALTQHHVVLEASPRLLRDPRSLDQVYLRSQTGQIVPLSAVAHVKRGNTTLSVNHLGQFPVVTISFNLAPGTSLSLATDAIADAVARLRLPSTIHGSFQGTAKVFQESLSTEPLLILAALLAVYIILGMLYESLIHPLTILSTLPSAGVGALLALLLTGNNLSIVALIGIILLIGIVKKNAIMMIDFALELERTEHLGARESIHRACVVRFRPIMMTTMAALFGALPLALEGGVGAELHKPLGISIVGGLILSQMLTLYTTPVVYVALDGLSRRFKRTRLSPTANSVFPAHAPIPPYSESGPLG